MSLSKNIPGHVFSLVNSSKYAMPRQPHLRSLPEATEPWQAVLLYKHCIPWIAWISWNPQIHDGSHGLRWSTGFAHALLYRHCIVSRRRNILLRRHCMLLNRYFVPLYKHRIPWNPKILACGYRSLFPCCWNHDVSPYSMVSHDLPRSSDFPLYSMLFSSIL